MSLTKLDLVYFWFFNTRLCEPSDPSFQSWLTNIWYKKSTGISCDAPHESRFRGVAVTSIRNQLRGTYSQSLEQAQMMNMDVVYHYLGWDTIEVGRNRYEWGILDDILEQAHAYNLRVVLRVYNPPAWRTADGASAGALPTNNDDLHRFMQALTDYVRDSDYPEVIAGYVIWNEPNIKKQWGGQAPDAAAYMDMLQAAYQGAKAGDLGAVIVSAPLAPTADTPGEAINDLTYLGQLYDLGLANNVSVVGMNGLGFQHSPDHDLGAADYNFMRLKYLHDVMVAKGDTTHPVWALETGWLQDSDYDLGAFEAYEVSERQQALYLARSFQKASDEWPWLDLMTMWNLDFNHYYPPTSNFHWYSISSNTLAQLLLTDPSPQAYGKDFSPSGGDWSPDATYDLTIPDGTLINTTAVTLTTYQSTGLILTDTLRTRGVNFTLAASDTDGVMTHFDPSIQLRLAVPENLDPEAVSLYVYQDDKGWIDACQEAGNSCELVDAQLTITLSHVGEFSLVAPGGLIHFPIIFKQ